MKIIIPDNRVQSVIMSQHQDVSYIAMMMKDDLAWHVYIACPLQYDYSGWTFVGKTNRQENIVRLAHRGGDDVTRQKQRPIYELIVEYEQELKRDQKKKGR